MKLSLGLAAALAGAAAAANSQPAEVFLLHAATSTSASSKSVSLPRQLARLVFLQRLSPTSRIGSSRDVPDSIRPEDAISYLNSFGKAPAPLLVDSKSDPKQLLLLVEGVTKDKATVLGQAVPGWKPSFEVADPPSGVASQAFVEGELAALDMTKRGCSIESMLNPADDSCAKIGNRVLRIDAKKDSTALETLAESLPHLVRLAASGDMETMLVLLPESSRNSHIDSWSTRPVELRARQIEEVMAESEEAAPPPVSNAPFFPGTVQKGPIPTCFLSLNSCETTTNKCNGRGKCKDKYAKPDGTARPNSCFYCRCEGTVSEKGTHTNWAGPTCTKIDVSTPFWLFVGFTIVMVGVLSFALGLLFSVGEEQLPGVIGAGVSKSK